LGGFWEVIWKRYDIGLQSVEVFFPGFKSG
jgi:hypothetical protein